MCGGGGGGGVVVVFPHSKFHSGKWRNVDVENLCFVQCNVRVAKCHRLLSQYCILEYFYSKM